jgi:hypothetical protein
MCEETVKKLEMLLAYALSVQDNIQISKSDSLKLNLKWDSESQALNNIKEQFDIESSNNPDNIVISDLTSRFKKIYNSNLS